ncbi:hypothetical protein JCM11491_005479 [Sporobolomyces phaffii]
MATAAPMQAIVKSVLSADTLVLRGKIVQSNALPREKVLHLADLSGPRLGTRDRDDDRWAFEARDYLRALVVGREVSFTVSYAVNPTLEFGRVYVPARVNGEPDLDVAAELVRAGWATVRESTSSRAAPSASDEESEASSRKAFLQDLEADAKAARRGVWTELDPPARQVEYSMPPDPAAFLAEHKGQPVDAIVEQVPNGSTLRARLLFSPTHHHVVNVGLAGVRAPRAGNLAGADAGGDEFGDEARFFVESRLLQRLVQVTLLALPTPTPTPNASSSTTTPNLFLGTVAHPAGNIAALVVEAGLAKCVDWHAGFLSVSPTPGAMSELRRAERDAKLVRRGVWRDLPDPELRLHSTTTTNGTPAGKGSFTAWVVKVWGADMVTLARTEMGPEEKKVQLASIRQPKPSDPKLAGLQLEAKEFVRKKLIGKQVVVTIDYVKPAEGDFEQRECATIRLPGTGTGGANIAELLVERGLVSVLRHRQGDDQRSSEYDALLGAEMRAIEDKRGVHAGREFPAPRVIDASESAHKAAPFLSQFKRAGRLTGVVDFVASGSRFKIWIPKQDVKLTFVLANIRAPRTARNASEKSEPFGPEAALWSNRKLLQREVEFSVDATDKAGGFIGRLAVAGSDVAAQLVAEGLAKVDEYATAKDLVAAQAAAQEARKGLWKQYDPAQLAAAAAGTDDGTANGGGKRLEPRKEYVDVVVSEVRGGTETLPFSFSVQILQNGGIPELESLMSELTLFHRSADVTPAGFTPRSGDLVSAKFSQDGQWYRAKVRKSNPGKKEAEVLYIDYGNSEVVPYSRLRPLASQFKALEGQAKEATLSFVSLLDWRTEYGQDAMDRFRELCEGQTLVANIDHRDAHQLLHLSLFDPADPNSLASHESSINVELVREGLARVDRRSRLRDAYPGVVRALDQAVRDAKRGRYGAYELGDILEDD